VVIVKSPPKLVDAPSLLSGSDAPDFTQEG
jgi:hypothetical protein